MSEKERLTRIIETEFKEWQNIMNAEKIDGVRRKELEQSIHKYAVQYRNLTGKYYTRSNLG